MSRSVWNRSASVALAALSLALACGGRSADADSRGSDAGAGSAALDDTSVVTGAAGAPQGGSSSQPPFPRYCDAPASEGRAEITVPVTGADTHLGRFRACRNATCYDDLRLGVWSKVKDQVRVSGDVPTQLNLLWLGAFLGGAGDRYTLEFTPAGEVTPILVFDTLVVYRVKWMLDQCVIESSAEQALSHSASLSPRGDAGAGGEAGAVEAGAGGASN